MALKNSAPSSMLIESTLAMDLPLNFISRVFRGYSAVLCIFRTAHKHLAKNAFRFLSRRRLGQASQRPALDVKAKPSWFIAACFRFGQAREPFANGRKRARICCRVRARCAANRGLVNVDKLYLDVQTL